VPSVSGVIVTHNGGEKVLRCIAALKAQTVPFHEILVIDNASTDGSPAVIRERHPDVRLVELPDNRGPSVSRNAALDLAAGDLVFWIDSDIYADPTCLERLLAAKAAEPAELVVPRIMLYPEQDVVQCDGGEPHFVGALMLRNGFTPLRDLPTEAHSRAQIGASPSGCLLLERAVGKALGGFDESYFFYFEDYEFSLRLRILGYRILVEPAAIVRHDRGSGNPALAFRGRGSYPLERARLHMRNRLRVVLTHYAPRTLVVLMPALLVNELAVLAFAVARGWGRQWLEAWGWVLSHRDEIRTRRRWIQGRRRTADVDLLRGGKLPLAPGVMRSPILRSLANGFAAVLDGYWHVARRLL
jgi:GT2 family glycosyltransferase